MGTCLGVPQRVLFECFLVFFGPKNAKKHSLGHSEAGAQNCSKSTPWGTFRPGPRSTPVNGGRDRKPDLLSYACSLHFVCQRFGRFLWKALAILPVRQRAPAQKVRKESAGESLRDPDRPLRKSRNTKMSLKRRLTMGQRAG